MKQHATSTEKRKRTLRLGYVLLIVAALVYIGRAYMLSLFFAPPDRLNVVFYSDQTYLYSLGIKNGIHYIMPFPSNMKIQVPGGYGEYRVGALGKLIGLEKDPDILKRAFTYNSSSFVPYYFYPGSSKIYYSSGEEGIHIPTLKDMVTASSNTSWLNKAFIYSTFATVSRNDFIPIDTTNYREKEENEPVFSAEDFNKKFIGYFYNRTYRTERKTVQIMYTDNYNAAVGISQILKGNGIRVVDISRENQDGKRCQITEELDVDSLTAGDMLTFFGCTYKKESSSLSDIVLRLGTLESDWEIN